MSLDTLTWSALIISLTTVVVLVVMIGRMNRNYRDSLRCVTRNIVEMQDDPDLRQLCNAIHAQYPDLCAGLDFELVKREKGAFVKKWMNQNPEPDQEQIKRMLEELKRD